MRIIIHTLFLILIVPGIGNCSSGILASGDWGTLWYSTPMTKIMRDTPVPGNKITTVEISAARNEFEPFQVVIRPTKALANVRVTARTINSPEGAKIEAWNIVPRNVEYVHIRDSADENVVPGAYPDVLPEFKPFTAPAGMNSPVWMTVYIAPKAAPGDYTGSFEITADGMPKLTVPLRVRVWDFQLPTVSALRTSFARDMEEASRYHGAKTIDQKRKLVDIYNRDFWRHRVSPEKPYDFYDIKASLERGSIKIDYSDFDTAVAKYFAQFNTFRLPGFEIGNTMGLDMGAGYQRLKIDYMRSVSEHLVNKGQLHKGYAFIANEPAESEYGEVEEAARIYDMADNGITTLITGRVSPGLYKTVDIKAQRISESNGRARPGEQIWWHIDGNASRQYPDYYPDSSAIDHRIITWIAWKYGVRGILYQGSGHPAPLIYPAVREPSEQFVEKTYVPSIRWELIRESIEDYDYLKILQSRVAEARKSGKSPDVTTQAEAALEAATGFIRSTSDFDTDPKVLDAARANVAKAILALQ